MENPQIQLIKRSESYKLTVKKELEEKIRFLCDKLPANEWSGTLFYTVEGTFKDKDIHIICKDFFLQDVGASTFTEFKNDENLASYMVQHELWDCCMGLMHSHNMMNAFFSSTDLNTLKDEGSAQNHFVSLIVSNAGVYCAAITRKVTTTLTGINKNVYNTFNNVVVEDSEEPYTATTSYLEYYPLEVTIEEVPKLPKSELELRLDELKKSSNSYINRGFGYRKEDSLAPYISSPYVFNKPVKEKEEKEEKEELPYNKEAEVKEVSLFTDEEMGYKELKYDKDYNPELDVAYGIDHIDSKVINNNVVQIITGDIFSMYKSSIDLTKWANNMDKLYAKRFPNIDSEYDSFTYWADTLLDFLENEVVDEAFENEKGREYLDAIWAYDLIEKLSKYPSNKYLDAFIESLNRWLI